jgi:hypothetical protein
MSDVVDMDDEIMRAMLTMACPRCGQRPQVDPETVRARYRWEYKGLGMWSHRCRDLAPDDVEVYAISLDGWEKNKSPHTRLQPLVLRCEWRENEMGPMASPCSCLKAMPSYCWITEGVAVEIGGHWPITLQWGCQTIDGKPFPPAGCIGRLVPDDGHQGVSDGDCRAGR